jgi:hypothetical protein
MISYILVSNQLVQPSSYSFHIAVLTQPQTSPGAVSNHPNAQKPFELSQIPYLEPNVDIVPECVCYSLIAGSKHVADVVDEEEHYEMVG